MLGDASASLRSPASPMESVHGGQRCLAPGEGSPIRRLILDSANLNDGAACPGLSSLLPTPENLLSPTGSLPPLKPVPAVESLHADAPECEAP